MPESEIFKMILQLGSFGVLLYAVLWVLRVGWPEVQTTIKVLAAKHEATVNKLADSQENALRTLGDRHENAVAVLVSEQRKLVETMDDNCRQERIQMAALLQRSHPDYMKP